MRWPSPTTLAVPTQVGRDLLTTLTATFNPLPAIALPPLALLSFGRGAGSIVFVLIPAAPPAILSGLKIGWAFAGRTLIAAEFVFGPASGKGGLGWSIYQNRNELYTDRVFAGLLLVVAVGLAIENLVLAGLEQRAVRRWGMVQ